MEVERWNIVNTGAEPYQWVIDDRTYALVVVLVLGLWALGLVFGPE